MIASNCDTTSTDPWGDDWPGDATAIYAAPVHHITEEEKQALVDAMYAQFEAEERAEERADHLADCRSGWKERFRREPRQRGAARVWVPGGSRA